ncbi:uncharacterized protein N0V89_007778 [Didymosphaeria variabile]|uniref:Actin-like ATPase domain-containing protein n=1 Tax=Didymosphaeria variabile TaxID=1932322 RepID=A0A9W8XM53_9PLEO|nr:uncharacterized protein N0V89_007778 [Didymosphaeria variabile]KAJ4352430.1 hypothetical protein N0V89_007778 [Didymosphaeria variabile]
MALELVVGIDFGTTYSGVSWVVNGGTKDINLINDWPNPTGSNANTDKVPTIVSYKNGKPINWGYEVDTDKEVSVSWFKLLLDPKQKARGDARALSACRETLADLGKSAEDVATDYFRFLWQYTKKTIEDKKGETWESSYTLKLVITVPAIWSQIAKQATLNAAKRAGLPNDISLVTEPEAAALAVLKAKEKEPGELQLHDSFVICDAGGGTVDLITYKITKLDPLQIEEGVAGEGDGCGSVHLDVAFKKYIQMIVGEKQYNSLKRRAKSRMLREYENGLKRAFSGTDKEYTVELPGVDDNEKEGIDNEMITLKPRVLRTLFDHVINQIVVLVENQVDEAQVDGQRVKAILLVGGFGTNHYMHKRLKDAHNKEGIEVFKVTNGWSSICRGAATWGVEHSLNNPLTTRTVAARIARFSYGNCWCVPFDSSKGHLDIDKQRLPDQNYEWWAVNQMEWILKKGERIQDGHRFHTRYHSKVQEKRPFEKEYAFGGQLYFCAQNDPPSRKTVSVKELCSVAWRIDRVKLLNEPLFTDRHDKQNYRTAIFDLHVTFESATIRFEIAYKGETVAFTEAKYKEDEPLFEEPPPPYV